MSTPSQTPAPGLVVGDRYRIEELIGQGGFGAVYRAIQLNLGRAVALKVLLPEVLGEDGLLRFQREAELAQRLSHPNTVRVMDFGRAPDGSPFLVFELLSGHTLEAEIVRSRGLTAGRVARVATQVLKALMEAHALGIVHRDIKPANVFLCDFAGEPDFVKILDFGIAIARGSRQLTLQGHVLGTPRYMAPEQVAGEQVTFAADVYALGMLMSEAISGRPLFEGLTGLDIVREKATDSPVPHTPEALKSPLGAVILRATQRLPERRYASAGDMLAHVESVMPAGSSKRDSLTSERPSGSTTGLPAVSGSWGGATSPAWTGPSPVVPPAPEAPKGGRKRSATPWVLLAVLAGGAAMLGLALFLLMPKRKAAADSEPPTTNEETESRPVVLTGSLSSGGWIVQFHVLETPSNIEYKHPGDSDWVSLGTNHQDLDPATNLPRARSWTTIEDLRGRVPFEVRYRTKSGALKGPFDVIFDTAKESVASVKNIFATTRWVNFHSGPKGLRCYFTVVNFKHAFSAIRYGLDSELTDKALRFVPSDRIGTSREDQDSVDLPDGVSSVTVELTYLDGTKEKKRFKAKADR